MLVTLTINGEKVSADVAPSMRLLDFLRGRGLKAAKCGCDTTNCGACTVWLDGEPVLSCAVPMGRADGHAVATLESLRAESELFARCMAAEGAEQCGFCSPGLIMNVLSLASKHPCATDEQIRRYLSGNLCRCSGYASQMRAVRRYLALARGEGDAAAADAAASRVSSAPAPCDREEAHHAE